MPTPRAPDLDSHLGKRGMNAPTFDVFIENEQGSQTKNLHDEKELRWLESVEVSEPYPYAYGFITGTTAEDGDNVDCFVLTSRRLQTGAVVRCVPIGLMEQYEDGVQDHNVLAVPEGETAQLSERDRQKLVSFVENVFRHRPEKTITAGAFHTASKAVSLIHGKMDE